MGSMIELVLADENVSVDRTEMRTAQSRAGHQARSQVPIGDLGVRGSSNSEVDFVVRQDSEKDMKKYVPILL